MKPPKYYKKTTNLDGWRKWRRWIEQEFEKKKINVFYQTDDDDINYLLELALKFHRERDLER